MNKVLYYGEVYGKIEKAYVIQKFNLNEILFAHVIYYYDTKNYLYITIKNRYCVMYNTYNEVEWALFRLKYSI